MKRGALMSHLKRYGCKLYREGGNHSVFWNPAKGKTTSLTRHNEISDKLSKKICRD
ncbi:MAG: type II toxin-antitoxin system HicA family toxin [Nitrospirae bacterium]|nr:type II toxin-antitoxin system HicA family toxin [Nitrospirota bacterium]